MREIKFRAWNKDENSMVDLKAITPLALSSSMNNQMALQGKDGLFLPFFDNVELMQYTGLKDKNGKEVFEGDIVSKAGAFIVWSEDLSCWCFAFKNDSIQTPLFHIRKATSEMDVIGNIYENANLLAESK